MASTGMAGDLAGENPSRELADIETILILSLNVSMIGRSRDECKGCSANSTKRRVIDLHSHEILEPDIQGLSNGRRATKR